MRSLLTMLLLLASWCATAQIRTSDTELFIEIAEGGKLVVTVDDEYMNSRTGRFRFYDLKPGYHKVSITLDGRSVFKRAINLRAGTRTMAVFNKRTGFKIADELEIYQNNRYALDSWAGYTYSPTGRPEGRPSRIEGMNAEEFGRLQDAFKKETFDDGKSRLLAITLKRSTLSTEQLIRLLEKFTFDKNRVAAALDSYGAVSDKRNFYLVRNLFSFDSDKKKIDSFILNQ